MVQRLRGWYIVPTCSIFLALATVAVTLRFISRYKFGVKIGPDDILIIVALLFAYAHLIDIILFIALAYLGAPITSIPKEKLPTFFIFYYSIAVLAPNLLLPVKLSFFFLYQRYFFAYRGFTIANIILGAIVLVQWLVFQLLFILICIPPAHLWQPALPGTCLDIATVADGFAITSLVTDIAILALPVPLIWLLHLSRGQKTGLTMLFTLGGFAITCSGVRVAMQRRYTSKDPSNEWKTFSRNLPHNTKRLLIATLAPLLLWVVLEETVSVICACGIVIYPLIRGYFQAVYNSTCGRRHYHGTQRPLEDSTC